MPPMNRRKTLSLSGSRRTRFVSQIDKQVCAVIAKHSLILPPDWKTEGRCPRI